MYYIVTDTLLLGTTSSGLSSDFTACAYVWNGKKKPFNISKAGD